MQDENKAPEAPSRQEIKSSLPENQGQEKELQADIDEALADVFEGGLQADEAAAKEARERRESAAAAAVRVRQEREEREQKEEQAKKLGLMARIQKLDVGERAKLARGGDKECRSILIKDSNKQVSLSVLANPKITVQEIEMIAASRNVTEEILREIGNNRDWCKSYTVILALVNNPKTPITISLTHLSKLFTRDLRFLAKSKGVPEVIKTTAKRQSDKRKF